MSKKYKFIKETDSTNGLMKELIWTGDLPEGFVVRTDFQTRGKGQGTNKWESAKGKNLLFSILLKPVHVPVEEQFLISQIISLAIADSLRRLVSPDDDGFSIKWPNDIYWQNKKVGGILIENTWQGRKIASSVIGIGLNVNQKQFVSEAPNPVSLFQIFGRRFRRKALFKAVLSSIEAYYSDPDKDKIRKQYHQSLFRKNGFFLFRSGKLNFEAEVVEVANDGRLILRERNGKISGYYFKEVEFVL
ncbi:MAG: biotin--[acetyl-CoA-carboxylase] ligase [Paludibacter sp.]|nr:biotin--[acetyl-CoA-carboxylase] ligase [Paludibacter sp.]